MWHSLSFMLCVGSISALDFPQIGFCFVLAPDVPVECVWASSHVAQAGVTNSPAIMLLRLISDQGYN